MIKKHYISLLELFIGLSLAILLLTTLTYFHYDVERLNQHAEQIQKNNFKQRYIDNRLSQILPFTLAEHDLKDYFLFYTSNGWGSQASPSLLFIFDNGPSLDSERANHALARLYVDNEHRLCLATWSSPEIWKFKEPTNVHKEVLAERVESLQFQFYVAPDKNRTLVKEAITKDVQIVEPERKGEWVSEWLPEYNHLPAMMKVTLTKKTAKNELNKITYVYPLPRSQKLIVYE